MCGICGTYNPAGVGPEDHALVGRMMERLEHRGPDGDGSWAGSQAVLGHRRLAIIDLAGGRQPLFNETGDVGVILNGEIYNYRELRRELSDAGHRFATASDTEVIVHGYEEWGDDFVSRLRGMFAFAVWDEPRRRFLLGRDRFGVKPLYYAETKDRLLFASEIKALFADAEVPRRLNHARLAEYLAFRSVAGEETLFEGVREVAPGTVQVYEAGRRAERRYWSPEVPPVKNGHAGELLERGRELLSDSIRARLVSDVPLGTITSGGLDSSLVSAIAAEHTAGPIDTFCVGFGDAAYDERPFARVVADRIGSKHHTIEVAPAEIERELDRLTWAHDEPLTHPNSIPMHLIFRDAKERVGVTVLLSGEGADEVFGGYEWYAVAHRRDALRRVPALSLAAAAAPALGKLATLKKVMRRDYLVAANAVSDHAAVSGLVAGGRDYLQRRAALWPAGLENADGLFVYDQRTYLAPLLQRQDRMSMAAGLEAREPFLDHHLAEWANALPAAVKLAGGVRKALLKQLAARWLPDEIVHRRKVGFEMPLGAWLRRGGPLSHRVQALRDRGSLAGELAERPALERMIAEHDAGAADHTNMLWSLVALDSWGETFLGARVQSRRLPGAATGRVVAA
ncbi:MAG TPA: asparagine synthase (glutamine-hydrolyzing) [Pyrinomonadaceae bacterium]|jgi:asparagine synthase (glutamine-hydrolysing)|nr:asparagine synthase (glutamine-hydrolyzing) [Pyrinomonadaceae bacterium]